MSQITNVQLHTAAISTENSMEWLSATGPLLIPMTNDYLFRALLQRNNHVLKGLVGALLQLPKEEIVSVAVINPIILGEAISEKTFFLDVFVILNNHTRINLELQVLNEHNWPERSLSYLCRAFNNLNSGEDYIVVRPAIQIGLLDFTLFPDHPEFYATYQFMNAKNHTIYSDKLQLSVLNLTRKDLATESDKECHLHHWASFFKATTWEELKMLAKQDEFINEASETVYQLSQEELVRLQCEAREDYYRRQRTIQHKLEKLNAQNITIENQNATIENQNTIIESQNAMIENKNSTIENQKAIIENHEVIIEDQNVIIEKHEAIIEDQNAMIENQKIVIENHEAMIANQNSTIQQLTAQTASLQEEVTSLKKMLAEALGNINSVGHHIIDNKISN